MKSTTNVPVIRTVITPLVPTIGPDLRPIGTNMMQTIPIIPRPIIPTIPTIPMGTNNVARPMTPTVPIIPRPMTPTVPIVPRPMTPTVPIVPRPNVTANVPRPMIPTIPIVPRPNVTANVPRPMTPTIPIVPRPNITANVPRPMTPTVPIVPRPMTPTVPTVTIPTVIPIIPRATVTITQPTQVMTPFPQTRTQIMPFPTARGGPANQDFRDIMQIGINATMQVDRTKFGRDAESDIMGNISWNMRRPFATAVFTDNETEEETLLNQAIRDELNNIQFMPFTRSIVVTLWDRRQDRRGPLPKNCDWNDEFEEMDVAFNVPNNWQGGMTYWQLLSQVAEFIETGKQRYGDCFIGPDMFAGFNIEGENYLQVYTWE